MADCAIIRKTGSCIYATASEKRVLDGFRCSCSNFRTQREIDIFDWLYVESILYTKNAFKYINDNIFIETREISSIDSTENR